MAQKTKMQGTPAYVADVFTRNAVEVTRQQFADLVEYALRDNTREEVAAIGQHMPANLRELLPRKYVH
jgi:hypothetical protein